MTYVLTLTQSGTTVQAESEIIKSIEFSRTHTGVGTWSAVLPYDLDLEQLATATAEIETAGGDYLFRGELESINSDELAQTSTLSGRGLGATLEDGAATVTYSNISADAAIQDYWDTYTSFTANVISPSVTNSVTGHTVQEADTGAEFQNILSIEATTPARVTNSGTLKRLQTGWRHEAEDFDGGSVQSPYIVSDADYSGGEALKFTNTLSDPRYYFHLDYEVPAETLHFAMRFSPEHHDHPPYQVSLDGQEMFDVPADAHVGGHLRWFDELLLNPTLSPGTHYLDFKITSDAYEGDDSTPAPMPVDIFHLFDWRYDPRPFDNTLPIESPGLHPGEVPVMFTEAATQYNITDGEISLTFDDATGTPLVGQMRLQNTWFNGPTSSFGSDRSTSIQARVRLDGFDTGSRVAGTDTGRELTDYNLQIDGNDLPWVEQLDVEGNHLSNLQRLHEFADMRFVIKHLPNAMQAESWRLGDAPKPEPSWTVNNRTREVSFNQYANHVTIRGAKDDSGTRPVSTASDAAEINTYGKEHYDAIDPSLSTQADVSAKALAVLKDRLRRREKRGTLDVAPIAIAPGYLYGITWSDGSTSNAPLEDVSYSESPGGFTGSMQFKLQTDVAAAITGLRRDVQRNRNAI